MSLDELDLEPAPGVLAGPAEQAQDLRDVGARLGVRGYAAARGDRRRARVVGGERERDDSP
ncbi:MAG: hypothetical protein ACRDJY_00040 [Thermoleophilaceae bacterium]